MRFCTPTRPVAAQTMLEKTVSFLATIKPAESRHFYETVLNLRCVSEDSFALVFELGPSTLRIQKVESIPEVNYTVLGWQVDNIHHCVNKLTEQGVQFEQFFHLAQTESGIWTAPSGAHIAWFQDPDGHTLSLTQY